MARRLRCTDAGDVYHLLNRSVGRATLFSKPANSSFEKVLRQAHERSDMRQCLTGHSWTAWCQRTVAALGLQSALLSRGRPRKATELAPKKSS